MKENDIVEILTSTALLRWSARAINRIAQAIGS